MIPIENINKANSIYKYLFPACFAFRNVFFNLGKEFQINEEVQVPLATAIERAREIADPQDLMLINRIPSLPLVRQNHILSLCTFLVRRCESFYEFSGK